MTARRAGPTIEDAVRCYRKGERATAERLLEAIVAASPRNVEATLLLARLALEQGNVERATGLLENATRLQPSFVDAHLDLADLHVRADQVGAAEAVLRRALAVAPKHPGVLSNLGSLLASQGRSREGIRLLEQALALAPREPGLHFNLAIARKAAGDLEGAERHYREAAAIRPDHVSAWHNLGNLLLDLGRVEEAAEAHETATRIRRAADATQAPPGGFRTNLSKLRHDLEQLQYLNAQGVLPTRYRSAIADYEAALSALRPAQRGGDLFELPPAIRARLAPVYNRMLYRPVAPALAAGAVNRELDRAAIEADYHRNVPGITFVDDFLYRPALEAVRRFCLEATVWFHNRYANGYIGAFMDDGFCAPLLLQIAEELPQALPGIFGSHSLRKLWAFKYDSRLSGIPLHADFAAVNVNFWVTPDEANLDPDGGGLVVWDKEAPADWDFTKYNTDLPAMRGFLAQSGAKPTRIPHRQNRVVIFNSDLFHETARLTFKEGYENRRVNITMLYGKRGP